jgi:ribosomal protein S6
MAEAVIENVDISSENEGLSRIYEVGYLIAPSIKEEDVDKVVAEVRKEVEQHSGSFIAEGAPSLTRLSYPIEGLEGGKRVDNDRAYFGWLKFEAPSEAAISLEDSLKRNNSVIRHIVFRTVREETRAHLKAPQLREVRRTDTIKSTPKRVEESAAPVSEAQLDKALEDITAE